MDKVTSGTIFLDNVSNFLYVACDRETFLYLDVSVIYSSLCSLVNIVGSHGRKKALTRKANESPSKSQHNADNI